MFCQKLLLPAFAVLSLAAAESASICAQPTATINSQADASQFASCQTISGSLVVGPAAAGTLDISGPSTIQGDLSVANAGGLTSLTSSTIGQITGVFGLNNLTLLSTLRFDELTSVGSISWVGLAALDTFQMTATLSEAKSVDIENTFLSSLDTLNLVTVASFTAANNNRLKTISTQLGNVTTALNIASNGNDLVCEFPNLIYAVNATFRNVSSVSLPSLSTVNGSFGFYGNLVTSVQTPNLTTVGNFATGQGSLAFVANSGLSNISMPLLKSVGGGFQIANNTNLVNISFPTLSQVGGAIDFSGNFSTPSMPDITNVKGGFNMQSTSQIDCTFYNNLSSQKVIQGKYDCISATSDAKSGLGSATTTAGSASASSTKGAAASFGISEAAAGLSVVGGILQMLL